MEQNRVTNDDKAQELSESLGDMELPAGFEFSAQYGRMRFKTNMVIDFCDAGHDISASPNVEGSFFICYGCCSYKR